MSLGFRILANRVCKVVQSYACTLHQTMWSGDISQVLLVVSKYFDDKAEIFSDTDCSVASWWWETCV